LAYEPLAPPSTSVRRVPVQTGDHGLVSLDATGDLSLYIVMSPPLAAAVVGIAIGVRALRRRFPWR
jgi:hypothetical protein